jgi:hypothetical protein
MPRWDFGHMLFLVVLGAAAVAAAPAQVQVFGSAQPFALPGTLSGANITCLELPSLSAVTDSEAKFVLDLPVGINVTLTLTHPKATTTQAPTFTVPAGGVPAGPETEVMLSGYSVGGWGGGGGTRRLGVMPASSRPCPHPLLPLASAPAPCPQVAFQVPYDITFDFLVLAMSDLGKLDPNCCHFCVTVAAANKTLQVGDGRGSSSWVNL